MHFGSRMATVREVELAEAAPTDTCWIESVEDGWLFLLPIGPGRGSLISVSHDGRSLTIKSRLIGDLLRNPQVSEGDVVAEFAAYPRIAASLGAKSWLACGSAAMVFDPLCGEGAGNGGREAILACVGGGDVSPGAPAKHGAAVGSAASGECPGVLQAGVAQWILGRRAAGN